MGQGTAIEDGLLLRDAFISEKVNSVIVEPFALIHLLTDSDFDLTNQRLFPSQVVC